MTITVKINPPDGNWQTACELIKRIASDNPGGELNFVVEDVFKAGKKNTAGGDSVFLYGNNQHGISNQINVSRNGR